MVRATHHSCTRPLVTVVDDSFRRQPWKNTLALIPAGGKSTRMGRPKLALPLGSHSVLELVIGALRLARIETILVVVGPHVHELVPLARAAGAEVLLLTEETADMRAT